eukprot:TRINITY_DN4934_c0_g1_i1.p1 TRINITY_DN4934_c0_g1~~TRINITY_DN4934_c0_g1_i1.p1  ORF type:complete len:169 (-),score=15.46 TRINITY_DN4934_c0_g1_i1:184-657(-)
MKIVWKLGHKIEITRAVKNLRNSAVNVMKKYFSARDLAEVGKQVSSSEERATSEPLPVGRRKFERGKVGTHRKRWMRPIEANGYKPKGGLKPSENEEVERSGCESDQSFRSQKSMPTYSAETRGISSGYKISTPTSNTLKEGENLDLSISKSHQQDA